MARCEPEEYKQRLWKFRTWLGAFLIHDYPEGCPRQDVVFAAAAKFQVSPGTTKNWLLTEAAADPNILTYRHAGRLMVKYAMERSVEEQVIKQAERSKT